MDIAIDGKKLDTFIKPDDFVSPFGWGTSNYARQVINSFLLEDEFAPLKGRIPLFVCPLCGDFECGVGTVEISIENGNFVWSNFRWERIYDDWVKQSDQEKYFKRVFEPNTYRETFERYRSEI